MIAAVSLDSLQLQIFHPVVRWIAVLMMNHMAVRNRTIYLLPQPAVAVDGSLPVVVPKERIRPAV